MFQYCEFVPFNRLDDLGYGLVCSLYPPAAAGRAANANKKVRMVEIFFIIFVLIQSVSARYKTVTATDKTDKMINVASLDGNSDNRVWRSNIIRIAIYMTIPAAVGNVTHILDCRFRDSANSCSHTDIAPAAAHSRGEMPPSRSNWTKAILRKNSTKQKACLQKFFHIMPTPRICRF